MANPSVVFYVAGHQDDWQLFRGEQAYADLNTPDVRVVFVYTTSGNANRMNGWWEARERGAIASVRAAIPASPLHFFVRQVNGHSLSVYECGNTTSYFLRLPNSVPTYSLSNLRDGVIDHLPAVDRSTTYACWNDFWHTLEEILQRETEAGGSVDPWVNASDYCAVRNPDDHLDHRATADALRQFVSPKYNRAWWAAYDVKNRPANLCGTPYDRKKAVFDAYGSAVLRATTANGTPHEPKVGEWSAFGARSYVTLRAVGAADD